MGKLAVFAVKFPSEKIVFSPGELVSGELFVQLNEPMEMRAITVRFLGKANVRWTETQTISTGKTTTTTTRVYSSNEKYFDETIAVHGEGANGNNSLPQGSHSFPFNFQLPSQLPSSYEDKIGHIRYQVKGTIVKPWKFDHNTKIVFTVLDALDLNSVPDALMPGSGSETKTLCCGCCKSGPITVNFRTDRLGFVPGEWVTVNGELKNSSNSTVKGTSAHIVQKITYHATTKTKSVTNKLETINHEGCGRHSSVTLKNARLRIPPVPPSEGQHCSIIDIQYFVQFEAHLRTFAINLREEIPIIVGTVPHRNLDLYKETFGSANSAPPQPITMPSAPPMGITSATDYSGGFGAPPPSYAAATNEAFDIKDEDDNEYTMGESSYIPQYTFYNWNESAFTYNK